MSSSLQYEIADKAKRTFEKANPAKELDSMLGNKLYDKYLKEKLETMQGFLLMEENQSVLLRNTVSIREIYQLNLKLVYSELRETTDYDGNDVPEIVTEDMRFSLPVTNRQIMALLSSEPDSYRDAVRVDLILDISGENEEGNASKAVLDCPLVEEAFNTRMYNDNQYEGARHYKDKVRETISSFTTLNQALKAWPALKDLVDQDKIDKVYEKVERKAKQQQERESIEIHEQELNSVILTASLLGD
tara:strand:- start:1432 stop:2169 length:738 start_codon:yes stop_codon:yes gene_type:complete